MIPLNNPNKDSNKTRFWEKPIATNYYEIICPLSQGDPCIGSSCPLFSVTNDREFCRCDLSSIAENTSKLIKVLNDISTSV